MPSQNGHRRPVITHAALLGAAALMFAGCSSGGNGGSGQAQPGFLESIFSPEPRTVTNNSSLPSRPDEPMTLVEKRRLVARLQQDPRTLQRLTPRERREVAAMVAAANNDEDEND